MRQPTNLVAAVSLYSALVIMGTYLTTCAPETPGSGAAPAPANPARAAAPGAVASSTGHEVIAVGPLSHDMDGLDAVINSNPGGAIVLNGCHIFGKLTGPPAGNECDAYYDTTEHWPCYNNGSGWVRTGTSTACIE